MTFYNIIFGILFLAAFQKVLISLSLAPDFPGLWHAITLSVLVFSDTVFTSEVIEGKGKDYTMRMKLFDLLSFMLLGVAILAIEPYDKNFFEVTLGATAQTHYEIKNLEPIFWGMITLYWGSLIAWNEWGGTYQLIGSATLWQLRLVQPAFVILSIIMLVLSLVYSTEWLTDISRKIMCALAIAYLVLYKPALSRYMSGKRDLGLNITLSRLSADDIQQIHAWPQYPEWVSDLDYALRANGWLDTFQESDGSHRYAIKYADKLVGFSILTGIQDNDAEFYIAIHPNHLRMGIGVAATRLTVFAGFHELRLRRIHLKVRLWHERAIETYQRVGFKTYGTAEEHIQGKPVHFLTMEILQR